MSWIIETLLIHKEEIRAKQDIESDEFNNLILVEGKIEDLYTNDLLSDIDMLIIDLVVDGKVSSEMEEILGKNRNAISKSFVQICDRIGYFLGGYFTDDGFLESMRLDYKLSEEDVERIKQRMGSRFKHKLIRKPQNDR